MNLPATVDSGAAIYNKSVLRVYDAFVHGFSNRFAWECPTDQIVEMYNECVSDKHLDIGVGTGYFLDRCEFPSKSPDVTLLDLNQNCLEATAKRIERYEPKAEVGNALALPPFQEPFGSIGVNYLLHCVPGTMKEKGRAFARMATLLRPGGVLFGSTILGQGVRQNRLAKFLMHVYNVRGIFSNIHDTKQDIEKSLAAAFDAWTVDIVGCVALFRAVKA